MAIVTGSMDKTAKIWDLRSRSYDPIQTLDDARDSVLSVYVATYEIITGSVDGTVRTYDLRMGQLRSDVIGRALLVLGRLCSF